jgi:hypothetical protein
MWAATDTHVDRLHFLFKIYLATLSTCQNTTSNNEVINIQRIGKDMEESWLNLVHFRNMLLDGVRNGKRSLDETVGVFAVQCFSKLWCLGHT